jgi:acetyl esterase/lipase
MVYGIKIHNRKHSEIWRYNNELFIPRRINTVSSVTKSSFGQAHMKRDKSKIHPELRRVASILIGTTVSKINLWFMRRSLKLIASLFLSCRKTLPDVRVENVLIPSGDGRASIRLRIYRPKEQSNSPVPAMVWTHGGGYVQGIPEMADLSCVQYVRRAGIAVISVDYRYAPEHPCPTGLEDTYCALKWIVSNAHHLNIDSSRIGVGGESAGGGLAAALAQLAADRKEITLVFQLLVYPMIDDRTCLRTDFRSTEHLLWDMASNRFGWASYLKASPGAQNVPAYAVPARRDDLSGLPPAWIGVGTVDLFHDEDLAYAKKLNDCGVECLLHIVPGAFHGFDALAPKAGITRDFRESQIAAIKKYLCKR